VFRDETSGAHNTYLMAYADDLLSGRHPMSSPDDFAVVADADNRIVATTVLMRMPLEYAGVAIPSGRPELVASHPDVRNRGYIRKIFQLIHAKSEARGDLMQGITGISYYYRQFGYEYALSLGGARMVPVQSIPKLAADQSESFVVRRAQPSDTMQLLMLYERERSRFQNHHPNLVT
jgi:predicted acetyltransferase